MPIIIIDEGLSQEYAYCKAYIDLCIDYAEVADCQPAGRTSACRVTVIISHSLL